MSRKQKILIYYTGTIGDTIIALPAFDAIRNNFPRAHITVLSALEGRFSAVKELLEKTTYADAFDSYCMPKCRILRMVAVFWLLLKLRLGHYQCVIYLMRDDEPARRRRDRRFFSLAGIRNVIGMEHFLPKCKSGPVLNVCQQLVDRLADNGIGERHQLEGYAEIQLTSEEKHRADVWFDALDIPLGKIPVAWGMGGKKQVCKWPKEKHLEVLKTLVEQDGIFPIFFGDNTSQTEEEEIIANLKCGVRAAISGLSLRESIAAMRRCRCYCGHDTGTMHMSVAAGLPAAVIFASMQPEGKWYPPGSKHVFLRHHCECECCELTTCDSNPARCIDSISCDEFLDACRKVLAVQ